MRPPAPNEPKARGSRMRAQDGDPWVSVSLLGEVIFCLRAGRFQHEQSQQDTGEEEIPEPPRRGWYRPPFTVEEIERELAKVKEKISRYLLIGGVLALFTCGLSFIVALVMCLDGFSAVSGLNKMLVEARANNRAEPDRNARQPQYVSWWTLIQAGWVPGRYEDPISDRAWRVTGKPWRILQRGSERIPVFRKRNEDPKLYRQHFARIAAYAHLIETVEGAAVPYGLILRGSSHEGITVPVDPPSKKQFHDALLTARDVVKGSNYQPPPRNDSLCRSCPWGKPMTQDYGKTYHSPCGDQYGWIPPHQKAIDKRLR